MRTFPKALATFRMMVNERGKRLRQLPFQQLKTLDVPIEHLTLESRPARIGVIVQPLSTGGVRVVVQGFMKAHWIGRHVAVDGFYKHPDETITPMRDKEFYEFG